MVWEWTGWGPWWNYVDYLLKISRLAWWWGPLKDSSPYFGDVRWFNSVQQIATECLFYPSHWLASEALACLTVLPIAVMTVMVVRTQMNSNDKIWSLNFYFLLGDPHLPDVCQRSLQIRVITLSCAELPWWRWEKRSFSDTEKVPP